MKFFKYIAAGNDFIVVDNRDGKYSDFNSMAEKVCERHFGFGADGLLVCENSELADVRMLYFNSDGSQGEICGNGIRSFTKFIYDEKIVEKDRILIETLADLKEGLVEAKDGKADKITINMGFPDFKSSAVPVVGFGEEVIEEEIEIFGEKYVFSALRMGVPHVVIVVEDIEKIDINAVGREIENHTYFPEKTNVNFIEIKDRSKINNYTWERGAGRTLGCGTGSCSGVIVGNRLGLLNRQVEVATEGGSMEITIEDDGSILMAGNATYIGKGEFFL